MLHSAFRNSDHSPIKYIAYPLILMVALALFWIASYIKIDYYDSFLILLNARCVAVSDVLGYSGARPIILPIILSPIFLLEKLLPQKGFVFAACHVTMVVFFVLLLWAAYRLYRLHLKKEIALAATLLLSLNYLLIHSAPFCKEDVFACLLMTTGFYFYLKGSRKKTLFYYSISSIFIALAIGARFNYPLIFPVMVLYEFLSGRTKLSPSPRKLFLKGDHPFMKLFFLLVMPLFLFALILSWHYSALGISHFWEAPKKYVTEPLAYMAEIVRTEAYVSPIRNMIFLVKGTSIPIVLCALLGIIVGLKQLRSEKLFYYVWLGAFFAYHTFLVRHKEARFLIPMTIPLYFFVAVGYEKIVESFSKIRLQLTKLAVLILLLMLPVKQAFSEFTRLNDPVYHVDFARELSSYAAQLAGPHQIYWIGHFYPVHPKDYIFDMHDVTTYIHHLYISAILLHTGKYVSTLEHAQFKMPTNDSDPVFIGPNAGNVLSDGEILVVNVEKDSYNTESLPKTLSPLYVQRVRKPVFNPIESPDAAVRTFKSDELGGAIIKSQIKSEDFVLEGENIPNGRYETYLQFENSNALIPYIMADVTNGTFSFTNSNIRDPLPFTRVFLLYFDSVKKFSLPTEER